MDLQILSLLLGYPLSFLASLHAGFLANKLSSHDLTVFEDHFFNSFISALKHNFASVDDFGKNDINLVIEEVSKDKHKLFNIIKSITDVNYLDIKDFNRDEFKQSFTDRFMTEYNVNNIRLASSIISDCLNQYELLFYNTLTKEEGLIYIIKYLQNFRASIPSKTDLDNFKSSLINSLSDIMFDKDDFRNIIYEELLNPESDRFSYSITSFMDTIRKNVDYLTNEQYNMMHCFRYTKKALISGCAGSGKTLVATEKALRLDNAGIKTLLLCHNPLLSCYIRNMTSLTDIDVFDITNYIYRLINKEFIYNSFWNNKIEPTDEDIYTAINKIYKNNHLKYDAIIVDEGQDFRYSWWCIIEALIDNNNDAMLYIFYDDIQSLLPLRKIMLINNDPMIISKNCRNAGKIFDIVRRFNKNAPSTNKMLEDEGIVKISSFNKLDNINNIIEESIEEIKKYIRYDNIKILTNEPSIENSILLKLDNVYIPKDTWQKFITDDINDMKKIVIDKIDKEINDIYNNTIKYNRYDTSNKKLSLKQIGMNTILKNKIKHDIYDKYGISKREHINKYLKIPLLSQGTTPSESDIQEINNISKILIKIYGKTRNNSTYKMILKENKVEIFSETTVKRQYKSEEKPIIIQRETTLQERIEYYSGYKWSIDIKNITQNNNVLPIFHENKKKHNMIPIYTIEMYKGMESDGIILFIITMSDEIEKQIYVGASRAVGYLHIIAEDKVMKRLKRKDISPM